MPGAQKSMMSNFSAQNIKIEIEFTILHYETFLGIFQHRKHAYEEKIKDLNI